MGKLSSNMGFNVPGRTPGVVSNTEMECLFTFGHIHGLEKMR